MTRRYWINARQLRAMEGLTRVRSLTWIGVIAGVVCVFASPGLGVALRQPLLVCVIGSSIGLVITAISVMGYICAQKAVMRLTDEIRLQGHLETLHADVLHQTTAGRGEEAIQEDRRDRVRP